MDSRDRKQAPALRDAPIAGLNSAARRLQSAAAALSSRRARDVLPGKIETKRLILRAPMLGDATALEKLANNKNIFDVLARLPHPYTRRDAMFFISSFSQRADERCYAITSDNEFIGVVSFHFAAGRAPELGYWLGEPFWGKGYGTEAAKGLIEAAHLTGHFTRIEARALAGNLASCHLLEKLGFIRTGEGVEATGVQAGKTVASFALEQKR
jgi:RimJ/RimL family protein N-acetyltransferase